MKNPFLDLGDGTSIKKSKIVLILNAESATLRSATRDFVRKMNTKGESAMPKRPLRQLNSLVLSNAYGKDRLYSSSRSAKSLAEDSKYQTPYRKGKE